MKDDEKPKAAKAEPPRENPQDRTVTGRVLGADGKPVVADLLLVWQDGKTDSLGKTKEDGTFTVTVALKPPGAYLVAQAAGHGVEFMTPAKNTPAEVTLKLPRDNPIRGRVIDTQGKPVAGAVVAVRSLTVYDKHPAERYLTQWTKELRERGVPLPNGDRSLWLRDYSAVERKGIAPLTTKTDKEGKFELRGVGAERLAGLTVSGAGVADTAIGVFNRARFDAKPFNEDQRDKEQMRHTFARMASQLFGPEPTVVVEQEKILRGRVTDELGRPRAGVRVVFSRYNRSELNPGYNTAVTDKEGRYEIRGARKHKGYMVEVPADTKAGLLPCQAFADDTVGYEPVTIDVKCARGVVLTGTIKDKATGKPISARVYAEILAKNPFVKDYPPFNNSASAMSEMNSVNEKGRFRVVTIPGPVLLMVAPTDGDFYKKYKPAKPDPDHPDYFHTEFGHLGYYGPGSSYGLVQGCWCKVIQAKKNDVEVNVDVELERSTSMTARVVDEAGKPLKGAHATGLTHIDFVHSKAQPDTDVLTVYNVEPGKERLVAVAHPKRKLVGTLSVKADDQEPVVRLGPGGVVSGRVVGPDGKPLAGVTVRLHYARREVAEAAHAIATEEGSLLRERAQQVVTGADGTFRITTVFPGYEFRLLFQKGKKQLDPDYRKAPRHTVSQHGDQLKVGDLTATPKGGAD
jgi:protocatechuate 3,4-dioxygenase beta subunit